MLLFDVIVFYSNACLELSVRDEFWHRTTAASIYAKLLSSMMVSCDVARSNTQRADVTETVTIVVVQSTTLKQSYSHSVI